MRNRSIAKALFCHLLTATLLNTGGVNGCISPSEEVHAFEGFEGENVVYLYLETAGFWSCTVLDEASGADMSGYFKTIMLNDSQPLVRVIRVFKSLPSTGRHSFRILQITCHCTVDGASKVSGHFI
ncbi:unnamed protein product [Lymnaea stagnalis]|uniref:Secreted protein n=1 Tax=Lymnaea stagnalis TaxID=6523 RepID=A0AAV2HPF1_LYMST